MRDEFRQLVIETLRRGEDLPAEWSRELFPPEKREYELVYYGKEREEDILSETMAVPLQPVRTFGKHTNGWSETLFSNDFGRDNAQEWRNMLILGDNLQVLKTLMEQKKAGSLCNADGTPGIKLIYIDPPFATKQDFQGSQVEKAYRDKLFGAEFIEFLRKRLVLLRELMTADGSILVHLDQRKVHYLKVILDEVFVEHNFRNEIILPGRASKNLQQQFELVSRLNVRHDTLLWYSRSGSTRFSALWIDKHKLGNPEGHWHHFWSNADRPTMRYDLFGHTPTSGQWTWKEERARRAIANYERFCEEGGGRSLVEYWRDTGCALEFIRKNPDDGTPQYWRSPTEIRLADTIWAGVPIYSNQTKYPTEKNEFLLEQVIKMASNVGDLVLDAFAGSGTTLAVAEKLGRRWIGIDSGKLSIYTIQKRMLNLRRKIGNKGDPIQPKPFTLYNAGLYDFSTLKQLPWKDWRFFALKLFGCKDEPHTVGGLRLDGKYRGASVLVFNHLEYPGKRIDEETILSIHAALGDKIGRKFHIIAPRAVFDFQQDYIDVDGVRYYAMRIPYSFINELHHREFSALQQPQDENAVNDLIDSVGFDFIRPPKVKWSAGTKKGQAFLRVEKFESSVRLREGSVYGGLETFSMLLLDFDYNGDVFDLDAVFYGHQLEETDWEASFPLGNVGDKIMAVFMDVHGNEAQEIISREQFGTQPALDIALETSKEI